LNAPRKKTHKTKKKLLSSAPKIQKEHQTEPFGQYRSSGGVLGGAMVDGLGALMLAGQPLKSGRRTACPGAGSAPRSPCVGQRAGRLCQRAWGENVAPRNGKAACSAQPRNGRWKGKIDVAGGPGRSQLPRTVCGRVNAGQWPRPGRGGGRGMGGGGGRGVARLYWGPGPGPLPEAITEGQENNRFDPKAPLRTFCCFIRIEDSVWGGDGMSPRI